jgi:hypothetical protein
MRTASATTVPFAKLLNRTLSELPVIVKAPSPSHEVVSTVKSFGATAWLIARVPRTVAPLRIVNGAFVAAPLTAFQVTSIFLILFVLQLLFYAFHEFTEANALPIDNAYWHLATEPYGPEGPYGALITYGLVLVPAVWLILAAFQSRQVARQSRQVARESG